MSLTPKRSFLLLIIGLVTLNWFFPIPVMGICGPIVLWAVVGKKWAIAILIYANLPAFIENSFQIYYAARPIMSSLFHAADQCRNLSNVTLANQCIGSHIADNMTLPKQFQQIHQGIQGIQGIKVIPKAPPFKIPLWLPFSIEIGLLVFVSWRANRMKNRIRKAIAHIYGFKREKRK